MLNKKAKPPTLQCLNCPTSFCGWFCPNCGQKSATKKLTLVTVIKDFMDAVSDSDKGFLRTAIDLSTNPHDMVHNYLGGKRQRYLSAGKYAFFLVVLFTINISYLEKNIGFFESITTMVDDLAVTQKGDNIVLSDDKTQKNLVASDKEYGVINKGNKVHIKMDWFGQDIDKRASKKEFLDFIKVLLPKYHKSLFDSLKIFIILWIPIFAFFTAIFFRKSGFNLAEHITVNAYIYSHILLIFLILSPVHWIAPELRQTTWLATLMASTFYLCYAFMEVFTAGSYRLVRTLTVVTMAGTTYLMVLAGLVAWQLLFIAFQNIDKL